MRHVLTMAAVIAVTLCSVPLSSTDALAGGRAPGGPGVLGASAAASGGTWGTAGKLPRTAAPGKGGDLSGAVIDSVSCASAGNCSAGGSYADRSVMPMPSW
jgi:hypothetical protein